jgi:hypothetical protein
MLGFLLRIARSVVENVINTINNQIRMVQEAITAPLRAMVQQVLGGVWKGDGANRFVAEMTNEVLPMLVNIGNVNMSFGGLLRRAMDIMDRADRQATQQAQQLYDVFNGIFR